MNRWKKYSRNPLERVKIVNTKHSSKVNCLNCGRILRSEFRLCTNTSGYQKCGCGYENHFVLIGDFLWEVGLSKIEPKTSKKRDKKQAKLKL